MPVRLPVRSLKLSAAGFAAWLAAEGFTSSPIIPVPGDVPTIGHGSTYYEDGTRVTMGDAPISRERAAVLARVLLGEKEQCLYRSVPESIFITQVEFDLYTDFIGQYGCSTWFSSTPRRELAAGNFLKACNGLLLYRFAGGRNCSLPENWGPRGCKGVWTRQQERNAKCLSVL